VAVSKPIPGTKGALLRAPAPKPRRAPRPGDGKGNAKLTDKRCACGCGRYLTVMCVVNREKYATRDCAGLPAKAPPRFEDEPDEAELAD
jgi:hypothetical protein